MMKLWRRSALLWVAVGGGTIAIACESSSSVATSPGSGQPPVVSADAQFVGSGTFTNDPDSRLGVAEKFQFAATGTSGSAADVSGVWFEGGVPPVGTYQLTVPNWNRHEGFWLFYSREREDRRENYAIFNGVLKVTSSSTERVEARFEAEAWLRCSERRCPDLNGQVPADAETIDFSGSVSLVPWDPNAVIPD